MNKFILCLAFIQTHAVMAQTGFFSLFDAINIGQEKSPYARAANFRYEEATYRYRSVRSDLLPSFGLNSSLPGINRQINSITQPDGTVLFVPQSQAFSNSTLSLSQRLAPTGGRLWVGSSLSRIDLFGNQKTLLWQSTPLSFNFIQPLFQVNNFKYDLQSSSLEYKKSESVNKEQKEELNLLVTEYYFDALIASISKKIQENNLLINEEIYNISKGRYNVGKIAENELLQVELSLLENRSSLKTLEVQLQNAKLKLSNLIDYNVPDSLIIPLTIPGFSIGITEALNFSLVNRSILYDNEANLLDANRQLQDARYSRLPNGEISFSFGWNQTSGNLDDAYKNLLDQQRFNVSFNMPILAWGKFRSQVKLAEARIGRTIEENKIIKQNIEQEVTMQAFRFAQLKESLLLSAKADTIAQKRYEVARNRYMIGKIDITNLYLAQKEKDNARLNYLGTLRDFWLCYYNIRRLTLYDFEAGKPL